MRIRKAILLMAMLGSMSNAASAQQIGRYQVTAVPASSNAASLPYATVVLLDTATGQTWISFQGSGDKTQWLPLRFWHGQQQPRVPLPPSAAEMMEPN